MARFTIAAVAVTALLFLSAASANRELQANSKCVVNTSAKSLSVNQIVCASAYEDAYISYTKFFCTNPNAPVPASVKVFTKAKAKAIAAALAKASAQVSMTGTISAACEPGSYNFFDAIVRAKAMAQAVAASFAQAYSAVIGSSAFSAVSADLLAQSNALAKTCETEYLNIYRYHKCVKTSCGSSTCDLTCTYNDAEFTTATARAVAVAIAKAEATVKTYYNSRSCDNNCKIKLCGYVCRDGC